MRKERKEKRQAEIEAIAYQVLEEKGFAGASMAAIAKSSKASMETLYNWYGDKNGLYSALVARNSEEILTILEQADVSGVSAQDNVRMTAEALLMMLSGPKAIALNRAAISDSTGTLGPLLSASGRAVVGPRLAELMLRWRISGAVAFDNPRKATEIFVSLLVGDHQIQRVTGAVPPLTQDEAAKRADFALDLFQRLFAPKPG